MMNNFFNIFILCSFTLILIVGEASLAFGDEFKIDQDFPFIDHGIKIVYYRDEGSSVIPTVGMIQRDGPGGPARNYAFIDEGELPDGRHLFASNFIKMTTDNTDWQQFQVVPGQSILRVNVNGAWSDFTQPVSDTTTSPVGLWQANYRDLYPIDLNIPCDSNSGYGDGTGGIAENDYDGDGICDLWETESNVIDLQTSQNFSLPCTPGVTYDQDPLGTEVCPDPSTPDIYYEIDSMLGHRPNEAALIKIVSAFKNMDYEFPNGDVTGINVHFQISDGNLPHTFYLPVPGGGVLSGYDALKRVYFGTDSDRGYSNPIPSRFWGLDDSTQRDLKSQVFHYIIFGHSLYGSEAKVTGFSEIPGNDAFVSLGGWDYSVGIEDHHAGTTMHEIGHNLNLHHGGEDPINCKPNYLSVMSYSRQFSDLIENRPLEFSSEALESQNEEQNWDVPAEVVTVYGVNSGESHKVVTGPGTIPGAGDLNDIDMVSCDGNGADFISFDDRDTMVFMDRSYGTFDEGRGSQTLASDAATNSVNPTAAAEAIREALENGVTPNELGQTMSTIRICDENIVQSVPKNSVLSQSRTCIRESLSYDNIVQIRDSSVNTAIVNLGNYAKDIEPTCLGDANSILGGIRSDIAREDWANIVNQTQDLHAILNSTDCISDPKIREEVNDLIDDNLKVVLKAVPEFEEVAVIVLSVSIISVIAITSRSKFSLSKMGLQTKQLT